MKPLILSEDHRQFLTKHFGPNPEDWKGAKVKLYHRIIRDEDGKVIGDTIGMCLQDETPTDMAENS